MKEMKIFYTILLIAIKIVCISQNKQTTWHFNHYWPAVDLGFGYRTLNTDFYNQLNTLNNFEISKPTKIIGIGLSDNFCRPRFGVNRQLYYNYVIPQNIRIQDTINCTINGFISSLSTSRTLFKFTSDFHLYLGLGINAGRLKLKGENLNKTTDILTPKLILTPSYYTEYFFIGLTTEYEYDFFNFNWKKGSNDKFSGGNVFKISQTGLSLQIRLGFYLKFLRKQYSK